MATTQHYVWAAGHFVLLLAAFRYLLAAVTFNAYRYSFYYKLSYLGAFISYAIVCYKALGVPQANMGFFRRMGTDENVQYFLLAVFWGLSKPVALSLVPFATFSLFHVLTFLRSNFLPRFFPPGPPATAGGQPQAHPTLKSLQAWIKSNYDPAMRVVAYAEIVIFVRVVLGAIPFVRQNSLLTPIIYAHFLRSRYQQSVFSQRAFAHVKFHIDGFVRSEGKPPMLIDIWEKFQLLVGRWVGTPAVPRQDAGNAARRPARG